MKKKFSKGLDFNKLFWIFIVCSVIGSFYEEIYYCIKFYFQTGNLVWSLRRGVIYGPFNIIYGLGACVFALILIPKNKNWKNEFISGSLLGGIVEFGLSYLQEKFVGTVSWDYSDKFLNIQGRTTIIYMMFWGICALFFVYKFYPFISKFVEDVSIRMGTIVTKGMIIFISFDMLISFTAVIRQNLRRKGIPAYTFIGRVCDNYYTDEFLKKYYPNMKVR